MAKQTPISRVASLMMYSGPSVGELISEATSDGNQFEIKSKDGITMLSIFSMTAYLLTVEDRYFYDNDMKLIRQILVINNSEKVVFDKYEEASTMLQSIEQTAILAS